jgi:hypothetical protein
VAVVVLDVVEAERRLAGGRRVLHDVLDHFLGRERYRDVERGAFLVSMLGT